MKPKDRKPDIEKFCQNCGKLIERKKFNDRIEDYTIYKRRKYCDHGCYVAMKKKTVKIIPPPPEPTKKEMQEQIEHGIAAENLLPVDYLLREMNNPLNTPAFRKECAVQAAPYCHPKLDAKSGKTKKEERAEAAGNVAAGSKFAPAPPPSKIVGRIGS